MTLNDTPMGNAAAPRVVIITGAAGGLGQALVEEFVSQGWQVVATYHTTALPEREGVSTMALDVTNRLHAQQVVTRVIERWGRIDSLINNAGLTVDKSFLKMDEDDWDRVLAVNLKGVFLCAQTVSRQMCKQREGQIINVGSLSGRNGQPGQANYAAAKAGLIGFTQALAKEVGSRNVRVNAVLPGVLPTAMTAKLSDQQRSELLSTNVLGRGNSLAEAARFIGFLATTQNVSGQVFQLDGRISRWT